MRGRKECGQAARGAPRRPGLRKLAFWSFLLKDFRTPQRSIYIYIYVCTPGFWFLTLKDYVSLAGAGGPYSVFGLAQVTVPKIRNLRRDPY